MFMTFNAMVLRRTQKREITTTIGSLDAKSIMPRAILSMYRLQKLHKTHTNTPSNDAANDDDAAIVYCALILCLRRPWHCQNISHTETQYEPIDFPKFAKLLNWFIYFTEILGFHCQPTKTHKLSDELNWNASTCKLNRRECRDGEEHEEQFNWVTLRYTCRLCFFRFRSAWATEGNSVSIYIQILFMLCCRCSRWTMVFHQFNLISRSTASFCSILARMALHLHRNLFFIL